LYRTYTYIGFVQVLLVVEFIKVREYNGGRGEENE